MATNFKLEWAEVGLHLIATIVTGKFEACAIRLPLTGMCVGHVRGENCLKIPSRIKLLNRNKVGGCKLK